MSANSWEEASFKPDLTDHQLPAIKIRTNKFTITNVTETKSLSTIPVFCRNLRIKASPKNIGTIYIGTDVSTDLTVNGYPLANGDELPLSVTNLAVVYFQGDTLDDTLHIIYGQ